jgi:putative ABC transport system permease protein
MGAAVTPFELALAALLLVVNGAIALALGLGLRLAGGLAIAAVRMAVQVAAIGLVLSFVLAQTSPAWTALAALLMVLVAGQELFWHERPRGRLRWLALGLGNGTLLLVGTFATLYAALLVAPPPWHAPTHFLPILGMVLGTTLTSVASALQSFTEGVRRERSAIEARIAQGAGRFTAFAGVTRSALRAAMTPLIATMAVAGVATFPGFMAGQIVAGVDPAEAARLQIALLLIVTGAAGLGALAAALGCVLLLTDARHRLRLDRTV